ncbi:zinc dependent phospholipase C family protein [Pelobacter propionicus]|uniref:Phospholipase C/D domain-containing protein n=1 Tax=Pelobacter propionicus (strain DSM 2379 / NBRC 103807 / OttBd1) TaxID=338966 RepID=A1AT46_PELPD|nr:zinc dependent phospholipase C family protein [Pelobacter propionicus]ABL00517.1 hypothetical protein Ppro_2919 [Pelobacter propionicus DSM 2379]
MPKEITHWILAERTAQRLAGSGILADIIQAHHAAYLGGAVLPDTLLHLFRGPHSATALHLADRFHDATGNSYAPLIRVETSRGGMLPYDLLACLLGVISHMQADMVFHPYVFALSGVNAIGRHYRLETAIDVHFLQRNTTPPVRRMTHLVTTLTAPLLTDAMAMLFDPDGRLPRAALKRALALHCRFQGMYNVTAWKIAALILGTLLGSPFREQRQLFYPLRAHGPGHRAMIDSVTRWSHPVSGAASNTSLDDLAEEAVSRTLVLFRRMEESASLAAALSDPPGANLLTGLYGIGKSEMRERTTDRSMR